MTGVVTAALPWVPPAAAATRASNLQKTISNNRRKTHQTTTTKNKVSEMCLKHTGLSWT